REKLEQFFSVRQEELEALSKDTAYKLTLLDAAKKRLRKEENIKYCKGIRCPGLIKAGAIAHPGLIVR
ncbi:MAG: hypothetical protein IKQ04_02770, partial [Oscillospiraceae bacterium]|nr:hypothetical protein [Oscillospiraceae bacterium]